MSLIGVQLKKPFCSSQLEEYKENSSLHEAVLKNAVNANTLAEKVVEVEKDTPEQEPPTDWLARLRENLAALGSVRNFGRFAHKMRVVSATPSSGRFALIVDEEEVNGKGILYGGQTASLVDLCTALVVTLQVRDTPVVSVELSCSFLSAALVGETVFIDVEVLRAGRTLIFTEAVFSKPDGTLVAKGKHTWTRLNYRRVPDGTSIRNLL